MKPRCTLVTLTKVAVWVALAPHHHTGRFHLTELHLGSTLVPDMVETPYKHPGQKFSEPTQSVHTCGLPCWRAWSDGGLIHVEPQPVNLAQEVIHRLAGRTLYQAQRLGWTWHLLHRGYPEIVHSPAALVFTTHDCSSSRPQTFPDLWPTATTEESDQCPF